MNPTTPKMTKRKIINEYYTMSSSNITSMCVLFHFFHLFPAFVYKSFFRLHTVLDMSLPYFHIRIYFKRITQADTVDTIIDIYYYRFRQKRLMSRQVAVSFHPPAESRYKLRSCLAGLCIISYTRSSIKLIIIISSVFGVSFT